MLKHGLLLVGLLTLAACSQAPTSPDETLDLAVQRLGTSAYESVADTAVDTQRGAVYAIGTTTGSLDGPNRGGWDVFLRRYSRSGRVVWKRQLGGANNDYAGALTVDRSGYVYASFSQRTPEGYEVSRTEKFRSDGTRVRTLAIAVDDAPLRHPNQTINHTDANGNVYIMYDTGLEENYKAVVRKHSSTGALLWTRDVYSNGVVTDAGGLATDASGNVYVAVTGIDDCCDNAELIKFSPDGTELFYKSFGEGEVRLRGISVRGNAVYVAGTLETGIASVDEDDDDIDAFVAKFSLGGTEQWRSRFGASEDDRALDVSADASGGVYVTGTTHGNLGGVYNGGSDLFFRKYSPTGTALWTKQIGSPGNDYGNAVAAYSSSELYLGGEAGGALLGGTHRGGQDGFLRRTDGQGNRVWTDQ